MDPARLGDFLSIVDGVLVGDSDLDVDIRHAATHSARIQSGGAFFALLGLRNGRDYVDEAFKNGAVVAVVARDPSRRQAPAAGPLVEVDDPLRALQRLAAWWRSELEANVVAVVGSNGKTITKDALVHFAGYGLSAYGSPGSYNSQLGVALAILQCPRQCDVAVIEVAVSDPGEMAYLEEIVRPNHVVLTNVGRRWQSRFLDRKHQAKELFSIGSRIGPDGWMLIGHTDEELRAVGDEVLKCPLVVFNSAAGLPNFSQPEHTSQGLAVTVRYPGGQESSVRIRTPSEEILADVELAMTAACLLGVEADRLLQAAAEYLPSSTRMEIWRSPDGVTIVRDVATPDPIAVGSAIRTTKRLHGVSGRMVVVLADPLVSWDDEQAADLARVLCREGAGTVYGLDVPCHRAVASALAGMDDAVPMRVFPSDLDLRFHLLKSLHRGDVALVQSPLGSPIGDLSISLIESMAPTRLYLDLSTIEDNVATFRRIVGPSVRIMGVVKAVAYGTDSVSVSSCLQGAGIDFLGVSGADEGAALRRAGVNLPVLVMLGTGSELEKMLRYRLIPLIYSPEMLDAVLASSAWVRQPVPVHVEVDTGMHRAGFQPAEATDVLRRLHGLSHVRIEGLMTHLACADDPNEDHASFEQLARFQQVDAAVRELGIPNVIRHAAATAATIRLPESHFDMVRIGIGLYGLHPSRATIGEVRLVPALGLVSRIVEIIDVPPGERVGYGGTYVAPPAGGRVGVVPAGYHDCIPRSFSNFGHVIVAGVRCSIIGTVSMDSMTIDLSGCPEADVGSDVLIYGRHNDWIIRLEDVSEAIGTIPHELMARVGPRVQRIFTRH